MATIAKLLADPNMIRFRLSGSAGNVDTSQAVLVGNCAEGPLKNLLDNPEFGADAIEWADLVTDPRLSVFITPGGVGGSAGVAGYEFTGSPNVLRLSLASGEAVVELRYNHSLVR